MMITKGLAKSRFLSRREYDYLLISAVACVMLAVIGEYSNALAKTRAKCRATRSRIKIEEELRYNLRTLRKAIDSYNAACRNGNVSPIDRTRDDNCYPPNLQVLVNGITPPNMSSRVRFLRRIPIDPVTRKREWGLRSVQDDPHKNVWGGENVFDVYSKSRKKGLDNIPYKDW